MKIIEKIKRRIHRFFHPPLEDSIRRFTTYCDWGFEELDTWSRRFDKLCHPFRKEKEDE